MKLAHIKSLGCVSISSISSFLFRRTKSTVSRIQFSARYKIELGKLTTVNMVEWEVTRQSSVGGTPLLYLFFLLMYLHKIVSQKC